MTKETFVSLCKMYEKVYTNIRGLEHKLADVLNLEGTGFLSLDNYCLTDMEKTLGKIFVEELNMSVNSIDYLFYEFFDFLEDQGSVELGIVSDDKKTVDIYNIKSLEDYFDFETGNYENLEKVKTVLNEEEDKSE